MRYWDCSVRKIMTQQIIYNIEYKLIYMYNWCKIEIPPVSVKAHIHQTYKEFFSNVETAICKKVRVGSHYNITRVLLATSQ